MLYTSSSVFNTVIKIEVYSLILSVFFGIIIAISIPLFNKANKDGLNYLLPIYNLFELCGFNGYKESIGFLFLFPILNIFIMCIMSYKLKEKFKVSDGFSKGLLFAPVVFIPILAYGEYTLIDEFKKSKSLEDENEYKKIEEAEVHDITVDSIFKTNKQMIEEAKPYRAKRSSNNRILEDEDADEGEIEKLE